MENLDLDCVQVSFVAVCERGGESFVFSILWGMLAVGALYGSVAMRAVGGSQYE